MNSAIQHSAVMAVQYHSDSTAMPVWDIDVAPPHPKDSSISNLQIKWKELSGRNAPPRFGTDLLRRAIAYRQQELEHGGLNRRTQLRLKSVSQQKCIASKLPSGPVGIKPGTRFVREWQNEVHEVQAIDTGDFVYRGKTYASLSTIAREITGTHQSGPRFFGMGKHRSSKATEVTDG